MKTPAIWNVAKETLEADCRVFKIFREHNYHPIDGREGDFFVAHAPEWVTCIAVCENGNFILEQQFRFGTRTLSWEFPGGIVDAGESPLIAATRELQEETGYTGNTPVLLAKLSSNPAIFNNHAYIVLIENCKKTEETSMDENEEIISKELSPTELLQLSKSGEIHHSIMNAAIAQIFLHRPELLSK